MSPTLTASGPMSPNNDAIFGNNGRPQKMRAKGRWFYWVGERCTFWPRRPDEMSSYRRTLIIAAAVGMALMGAPFAEGRSPSPPEQTNVPTSPPPVVAAKSRAAARTATVPAAAFTVTAKQQPTCTILTCLILVGVGF